MVFSEGPKNSQESIQKSPESNDNIKTPKDVIESLKTIKNNSEKQISAVANNIPENLREKFTKEVNSDLINKAKLDIYRETEHYKKDLNKKVEIASGNTSTETLDVASGNTSTETLNVASGYTSTEDLDVS